MLLLLAKLLSKLPLRVLHALGGAIGWLVYWFSPTYRQRVCGNLAQAGLSSRAMRRRVAVETGKQMIEPLWMWLRPADDLRNKIVEGEVAAETAALARGGPVVFLAPHLGAFEAVPQRFVLQAATSALHARPVTVLYRIPHKRVLQSLLEAGRTRHGTQLAAADLRGVRALMRALKNKEIVGILPDQVPSQGEGVWAPFFGRPAYTMTLPMKLAHMFKAQILMTISERLPQGRGFRIHVVRFEEPLTGDPEHDAAAMNRELEKQIRRFPEQYLWGYNRYKKPQGAPDMPAAPGAPAPQAE